MAVTKEWAWIEGLAGKKFTRGQLRFIGINIHSVPGCVQLMPTTFSLIRDLPKIIKGEGGKGPRGRNLQGSEPSFLGHLWCARLLNHINLLRFL